MSRYPLLLRAGGIPKDTHIVARMKRTVVAVAVAATLTAPAAATVFFRDTFQGDAAVDLAEHVPDIGGMWTFPFVDFFDGAYWFSNRAPFIGASNFQLDGAGGLQFVPPGTDSDYHMVLEPGTQPTKPDYYVEVVLDANTSAGDWMYGLIAMRAFPNPPPTGWTDEIDALMMEYDVGANADEISLWNDQSLDGGTNSSSVFTDSSVPGDQTFTLRMTVKGDEREFFLNGVSVFSDTITEARFLKTGKIYLAFDWGVGSAAVAQRLRKVECGYL